MTTKADRTLRLDQLDHDDLPKVGSKAANLGELIRAGFAVPPGFVLTADAYFDAIEDAGVREQLLEIDEQAATASAAELTKLSKQARLLIDHVAIPDEITSALAGAYRSSGSEFVAVRSSPLAHSSDRTSFAGMNKTFTNIKGIEAILSHVQDCWSSLYGPGVMAYRSEQGLTEEPGLAVVIQQMVHSDSAGVILTVDPSQRDKLLIEAAFGLGEVVVGGRVEPDSYRFDRTPVALRQMYVGHKHIRIVAGPSGDCVEPLDDASARSRALNDQHATALAKIGLEVEAHFGTPQDIEWSLSHGEFILLQSRPITTMLNNSLPTGSSSGRPISPILNGVGVGSKRVTGVVKVASTPSAAGTLEGGEILVVNLTNPDWEPVLRRASGLITNTGGSTSHAAVVSREFGLPGVIGTQRATRVLRDGDVVTFDALNGRVFLGAHG